MIDKLKHEVGIGNTAYFYNSWTWRKKRLEIIHRDNNECQECKGKGLVTVGTKEFPLVVHHKNELKDFPKLMLEESNLISVCFNCHERIHGRDGVTESKIDELGIPERWE